VSLIVVVVLGEFLWLSLRVRSLLALACHYHFAKLFVNYMQFSSLKLIDKTFASVLRSKIMTLQNRVV
jgi:hypothetical protein